MGKNEGKGAAFVVRLLAFLTIVLIIAIGAGLGFSLAETANIINEENFLEISPALPTRILDINGTLVTEFASDEKRELVALNEMPKHLIYAVLAREDPDFYNHKGFSIRAIIRAAWGQLKFYLFKQPALGGGSTITQQVAGTLYTNRNEITISRKLRELWWALQMERRYSKNEIMEIYLNYMPMGPGTYGVETASKYFFKKSARDITVAESAALAVLLSGPSRFDPLKNPGLSMDRQHFVLERMIEFGYVAAEEAEASFTEYWNNFDWTQPALSAYLTREDKAPWFSEYVRRELETLMYGTRDYFRDGYVVYTTLDLEHQALAEKYFAEGLARGNREYIAQSRSSNNQAIRTAQPIVDLLTLMFNLTGVHATASGRNEARAVSRYTRTLNPVVDMLSLAFGIPELKDITGPGFALLRETTEQNVVEGALITIENETGYITAIVGGSKYDESNQLIRATQAAVQPGSAFKTLYYSAAIDSRKFTTATLIYDSPMAFHNEDGSPYVPSNYGGAWRGPVLLYNVLSLSLNIPSLYILEKTGFDAAINRAATLLGITNEAQIRRLFPRVYPLGLGITSVSPLQMARAYAIFANQGRDVTPIAIRTIEDRNGRVIFDIEREVRQRQQRMANNSQVVSPQNAYIMTRLMEFGISIGILGYGTGYGSKFTYVNDEGRTFRMPMGGKTGTTQNWADAWAVGYSPYYTTAMWYGFDRPGNSLGVNQTGAILTGPSWGDYMRDIHRGLPQKNFTRPSGIVDAVVCRSSGLLVTEYCNQGTIYLPFLEGTIPGRYCDMHGNVSQSGPRLPTSSTVGDLDTSFLDSIRIQLDPSLFPELQGSQSMGNMNNSGFYENIPQNYSPFQGYDMPVLTIPDFDPYPGNQTNPFQPITIPDFDQYTPAYNDQRDRQNNIPSGNILDNHPADFSETTIPFYPNSDFREEYRERENASEYDYYLPPWDLID